MTVEFDPVKHEYRCGGVKFPSVSQVLQYAGLIDTRWYTPGSSEAGTQLHSVCRLLDMDMIELSDLTDNAVLHNRAEAWLNYKAVSKIEIIESEKPRGNKTYKFCGTPDRVVMLNGRKAVLDIKSGAPASWHGLQLNGYRLLVDPDIDVLYTVRVKPDGKFSLKQYPISDEFLNYVSLFWRDHVSGYMPSKV